jgi:hypothetical protein
MFEERCAGLPYEMPLVGHCADCVDRAAAGLEFEVAVCFAALAAEVVDRVFVDGAVATSGVEEVAVRAPAGAGAPGRSAALRDYGCDGRLHAAIPDSKRPVLRGVEECGFALGWQV